LSLVGRTAIAPTGVGCSIEGTITSHNLFDDSIIIEDEDGEKWQGYEYQVEFYS